MHELVAINPLFGESVAAKQYIIFRTIMFAERETKLSKIFNTCFTLSPIFYSLFDFVPEFFTCFCNI